MTEQSNQVHFNDEQNAQLAAEWLAQLKKQGRKHSWISAGLFAGILVSGGLLYKSHIENQALSFAVAEQTQQVEGLKESLSDSASKVGSLNKALAKSEKTRRFLEQIKGDTASQLNIAEQIIDTQTEKITLLEGEFSKSISTLSAIEGQLKRAQQRSAALDQSLSKSEKELKQRSNAYKAVVERQKDTRAEVDRLAKELELEIGAKNAARHALDSSKKDLMRANRDLNTLNGELAKLRAEVLASPTGDQSTNGRISQDHHALAIQPIVGQANKEPKVKVLPTKPGVVDPNALMIQ